ncbi:arginine-hydroxylase NDUFAF5, mitochondrial [Culicoides brevitarsis]|uniref:arginine-hydroxylase NDUFAF5, mitochondrial n=1 Tax=Culicoides brevitarsis TaxID=469753 RepID=UPI00307C23D2
MNTLRKLGLLSSQITRCHCRTFTKTAQNLNFPTANIFDRNAKKLQKERAARSDDVELFDYIKEEVGFRLSDRVFDVKRQFKNAVDLGCGRGYVSKHILADSVERLTLCDMSPTMLRHARSTPGVDIIKKELDEELFSFPDDSLDLVISNLSLHWVNDLPGLFKNINKALAPDGVFMASFFGGETLYELRSSLQLAEAERLGGLSPHISPFVQIRDVGALLNANNFTMLTIDTDEVVVGYPTMFELLWDLKGMGENNAAFNRPLHLSRDVMMAAASIYKDMYGTEEGVQATFQIIYLVGWKPHESQPKPMERGSANVSLKDLGNIVEGKHDTSCKKK